MNPNGNFKLAVVELLRQLIGRATLALNLTVVQRHRHTRQEGRGTAQRHEKTGQLERWHMRHSPNEGYEQAAVNNSPMTERELGLLISIRDVIIW